MLIRPIASILQHNYGIIKVIHMHTKKCRRCGLEKSLDEFYVKKTNSDGYRSYCKLCDSEINAQHRYFINSQNADYVKQKELERTNEELLKENRRKCSVCGEIKEVEEFYYRKDNNKYRSECKKCFNELHAEKHKIYRDTHKEHYKQYAKEYLEKNRDVIIKKKRDYNRNNFEKRRQYRLDHLEDYRQYYHTRKEVDPLYKFVIQVRNIIRDSVKRKGYTKKSKTFDIIGCDFETFIKHLKQTFKDNYGYDWDEKEAVHIDHIIPLATAKSEEDVLKLCHYTNLQLLKPKDNMSKQDKLDWSIKTK